MVQLLECVAFPPPCIFLKLVVLNRFTFLLMTPGFCDLSLSSWFTETGQCVVYTETGQRLSEGDCPHAELAPDSCTL